MKKGSVTVYMTWMLAVLLSLFVTVIEGARQRAISIQAETAVDLAVYSVFAEYMEKKQVPLRVPKSISVTMQMKI